MSMLSMSRGKSNVGAERGAKRIEPTTARPASPAVANNPDPAAEQSRLGSVSLQSVDHLTGMTADEIERVAEQVLAGADETAAMLRQLAARVRENGQLANQRLARFVQVTNQCADIARSMQQSVVRRDEPTPPQPKTVEEPSVADVADAPRSASEEPASVAGIAALQRLTSS
jgi:hypothetical protein